METVRRVGKAKKVGEGLGRDWRKYREGQEKD